MLILSGLAYETLVAFTLQHLHVISGSFCEISEFRISLSTHCRSPEFYVIRELIKFGKMVAYDQNENANDFN